MVAAVVTSAVAAPVAVSLAAPVAVPLAAPVAAVSLAAPVAVAVDVVVAGTTCIGLGVRERVLFWAKAPTTAGACGVAEASFDGVFADSGSASLDARRASMAFLAALSSIAGGLAFAADASPPCRRFKGGLPTGLRTGSAAPTVRDDFSRLGRGANDRRAVSPLSLPPCAAPFSASAAFAAWSWPAAALFVGFAKVSNSFSRWSCRVSVPMSSYGKKTDGDGRVPTALLLSTGVGVGAGAPGEACCGMTPGKTSWRSPLRARPSESSAMPILRGAGLPGLAVPTAELPRVCAMKPARALARVLTRVPGRLANGSVSCSGDGNWAADAGAVENVMLADASRLCSSPCMPCMDGVAAENTLAFCAWRSTPMIRRPRFCKPKAPPGKPGVPMGLAAADAVTAEPAGASMAAVFATAAADAAAPWLSVGSAALAASPPPEGSGAKAEPSALVAVGAAFFLRALAALPEPAIDASPMGMGAMAAMAAFALLDPSAVSVSPIAIFWFLLPGFLPRFFGSGGESQLPPALTMAATSSFFFMPS